MYTGNWQIFLIFLFKAYYNFKEAVASVHLNGTVIFSGGLLQWFSIFKGTVFLWNKHLQLSLFSKVLSLFAVPVAVIHSTNGSFSIIKEQLQPHILSYLLYFFRTGGVVVISREHLKRPIVSRALFISQPLLQPSIIASGLCVCLRKIIVALVL